ncbi:TPA: hypothetical protein NGS74_005014 [Vibrio parahaemolyticus]|nr:hypothetical protein [Vibrio parahaemolyticus]HCE1970909.1 hypothetical protein [Vibrio parahaemolyticus]
MTQNIEQRTLAATATMEGAAKAVDEIAHTDKDVSTPVGSRKSFPKISREWDEKATELKTTWENDSATLRQDWQNERNELSTKALGVKPWESGVSETNINQQRRWDDGHTYLPKTVPALMDVGGPNDGWAPYTADKSDTLNDVFGLKPIDLVSGITVTPDANQVYPKLNAFGKVWELGDSDQAFIVKSFSESSSDKLVIIADDSQYVAQKMTGSSRSYVDKSELRAIERAVDETIFSEDGRVRDIRIGDNIAQEITSVQINGKLYRLATATRGVVGSFNTETIYFDGGGKVRLQTRAKKTSAKLSEYPNEDGSYDLQALLDSPYKLIYIDEDIVIDRQYENTQPKRRIKSTGRLIGGENDIEMFLNSGNRCKISLLLDGEGKAGKGLIVTGDDCVVVDCEVENLFNRRTSTVAVTFRGDIKFTAKFNVINNIDSVQSGVNGDALGACRAFLVEHTTHRTKRGVIKHNECKGIKGREGDAIQVICFDGTYPFCDGNVTVKDNETEDCTRRAVKIQASSCKVLSNEHSNYLALLELWNSASLIDVIGSNNVIVKLNILDAEFFTAITSTSPVQTHGFVATDNIFKVGLRASSDPDWGRSTQAGVYASNTLAPIIGRNILEDGSRAFFASDCPFAVIVDNIAQGGNGGSMVVVEGSSSDCYIDGNVGVNGHRTYCVDMYTGGNIATNNHGRFDKSQTYAAVNARRIGNNYLRGNTSISDSFDTVTQYESNDHSFDAVNFGRSGSGVPKTIFVDGHPSNYQIYSNIGDRLMLKNIGSGDVIGWICTVAGDSATTAVYDEMKKGAV